MKSWDWFPQNKKMQFVRPDGTFITVPDSWDDEPEGPKKLGFTREGWLGMVPVDAPPTGQIGFVAGEVKDLMPEAVDD